MLEVGRVIDRYRVEARLGEGGMSSVWRVRHVLLDSLHALKVLHPELVRDPDLRERFLAEGRIQAQLSHPNIAAVTDLVAEEGVAGLVVEFLEGQTLEARLEGGATPSAQGAERRGYGLGATLSPLEALEIFGPVLDALGMAHDSGVIHRDLKPSNLFLCVRGRRRVRPVVLDFGVAKVREQATVSAMRRSYTVAGTRMGTVQYMSPEQIRDARSVDERTDIFALGATLYQALLGRPPFDGETEYEIQQRILSGLLVDPGVALTGEAAPLADVIRRSLATEAADRFPDCGAFADALELAVRGRRVDAWALAPRVAAADTAGDPGQSAAPAAPTAPAASARVPATLVAESPHRRFVLPDERLLLHGLRGTLEPYPRIAPRFSHALLAPLGDGWSLEPRGLAVTVLVDGVRVSGVVRLQHGSTLAIGEHRFKYVHEQAAVSRT